MKVLPFKRPSTASSTSPAFLPPPSTLTKDEMIVKKLYYAFPLIQDLFPIVKEASKHSSKKEVKVMRDTLQEITILYLDIKDCHLSYSEAQCLEKITHLRSSIDDLYLYCQNIKISKWQMVMLFFKRLFS